jgi:CubicO group peptidase (beta-lactamase class C family)
VDPAVWAAIEGAMATAMTEHDLRALIVRVTRDGREVYTGALGESMTGVPATTDMRVFNGAVAYTCLGELLVMLAQQGSVGLDDKLSEYLPSLPAADRVTLRMLANSTSGYADYVYTPEVLTSSSLTPNRQFDTDELIAIGTAQPMMFEPGTNWGYSHTNYAILGKVLATAGGQPLPELMDEYIVEPMGLQSTAPTLTTDIPPPVLHTWSSKRRADLQIPANLPFYEDSTFWNASWTTPTGALMTTDITDLTRTAEAVGSGELVSPMMYEAQAGKSLVGVGEKTGQCPVCAPLTENRSYGFALVLLGDWLTQTKSFGGSGASVGYLPEEKLAVAVITSLGPEAFTAEGIGDSTSGPVMTEIAAAPFGG